jgi:hypothetical protein
VDLADARRKVTAACLFLPGAAPTHVVAEQDDRMELHRALLRGRGFYDWMTRSTANDVPSVLANQLAPATARPLPVVNLFAVQDRRYADALLEEALLSDRVPFREYLTNRILGVGIITAVRFIFSLILSCCFL